MALGFNNVARNDLARVFLFPDGVYKCGSSGVYASCVSVDALAQDRGDVTNIECPSPYRYGEFEVVGSLPGELSRMTTTLTGHMSRTEISTFYKLFIQNCKFDVHLHFGLCQAPNNFAQFDKALVFEDVNVTAFSTDPLIALQSGDRAAVNESIDISIGRFYEVVNLEYNERGTAQTTAGAIVAVAVCDLASCGSECDVNSDGCQKMFAVSTDGIMYYSDDRGSSWTALTIQDDTPVTPLTPNAVLDMACWGDNVIVLDDANQLWIIDRDDMINGDATTFGIVDTAITNLASKLSTSQNQVGIIVGDNGDIAMFSDLEGGSTLVDAGFTTTEDLTSVHVGMDGTMVAGGTNGAVVYSYDGITWYNATAPVAQTITAVVAKNRYNWIVGTANGQIWCTDNSGRTWTRVTYPNWAAATAQINEFAIASGHVLYFVADNKLYRSLDGGNSWFTEPNTQRTYPTNTAMNAVASCWYDVNFVLAGGTAAATGIIINGTDPQ